MQNYNYDESVARVKEMSFSNTSDPLKAKDQVLQKLYTNDLRMQQAQKSKDAAFSAAASSVVESRMLSNNPYVSVDDMHQDLTSRYGAQAVAQIPIDTMKSLENRVNPPKDSDPKAFGAFIDMVKDGSMKDLSYQEVLNKISSEGKLDKQDLARVKYVYQKQAQPPSDAQQSAEVRARNAQTADMLKQSESWLNRNNLVRKRTTGAPYSKADQVIVNWAHESIMNMSDTFPKNMTDAQKNEWLTNNIYSPAQKAKANPAATHFFGADEPNQLFSQPLKPNGSQLFNKSAPKTEEAVPPAATPAGGPAGPSAAQQVKDGIARYKASHNGQTPNKQQFTEFMNQKNGQ